MLADCSRWDAECAGTAAERDGTKSLNPRRAALACARGNPVPDGLLRQIKTYKFVAIMHMMKDVLPIVDRLSKSFQIENISLATIKPKVTGAKLRLVALRDTPGEMEECFDREFTQARTYKDHTLSYCGQNNTEAYKAVRAGFIQELITNLENRFPENDLDVLSSFSGVFEAQKYPQADRELRDYGTQALGLLIDRFDTLVVREELRTIFLQFKYTIRAHGPMSFSDTCAVVITDYNANFPAFATLAQIGSVIPVSSVPCERSFRVQNRIKTRLRLRLSAKHGDNLMMLAMHAPRLQTADDVIRKACAQFASQRDRDRDKF